MTIEHVSEIGSGMEPRALTTAPVSSPVMEWTLHSLCKLFPMMEGADFELLKADIEKNGQRDPIVMYEGNVLDGQNRLRACLQLGIEPKTVQLPDGVDPVAFVLSKNLTRRHLKPEQRAAIVAAATDWQTAQTVGKPNSASVHDKTTIADRAATAEVSRRTQAKADRVAKAKPALIKKVAAGDVSLNDAVAEVQAEEKPPAPAPAPVKKTPLEKVEARVLKVQGYLEKALAENAALQAKLDAAHEEITRISEDRDSIASNAADLAIELEDLISIRDGEDAKRMAVLHVELRAVRASYDTVILEKAQLVKEVKHLNKRLGVRL